MAFIGIDLGTTTTEACIVRDGRLVMIKNEQGQDIFPSVVGVDPVSRGFIFGESAESLSTDNFKAEVKREMGTNNKIPIGDQLLCPEEVSALILKHIKKIAEKYLGEQVNRAVITVPANFNDLQRSATKKAGGLVGKVTLTAEFFIPK